ncbi:MAG: pyridoxal-phosphate dependent enzyme [Alphaproteobacteria bacterium]|nr:pyridoxal-phosphate dependent enzyme [Alphaproteobacteria bacterium]MBX9976860.1 pyridoxal-phosphate dependent enzyme [Alphaproteobacteria bacterium]
MTLTLSLIHEAHSAIKDHIIKTPLEYSGALSKILKTDVYLKLEFLQKTGSFKYRGALFSLTTLKNQGVCTVSTCSAGNHGKGIAKAAKELNMTARIFVPNSVDDAKYQGMIEYGAQVSKSPYPGYDATEVWARQQAALEGLPFISAFNDYTVMAGNGGTLALEILESLEDVGSLVFPVGGGGLGAGLCYYMKETNPTITLIGCQHEDSAGLALSLKHGQAITELEPITTVAGGLEGGVGDRCFDTMKTRINSVSLASEQDIIGAWRWILHNHQYLIEPTAAVTLACLLNGTTKNIQGPAVIVLSGRNVSYQTIKKLIGD